VDLQLAGRNVLVTGGAGLIGSAICEAFADEGARVAVADLQGDAALATAQRLIDRNATAVAVAADVSDAAQVDRMLDEATRALGPVDVLVNCHGFYRPSRLLLDYEVADWDRFFAVNTRGTMLTCRAVARQMLARGAPGAIVNITSGSDRIARQGASAYCASKAAVRLMTEVLAIELGPQGIRVNAVAPGLVMGETVRTGEHHPSAYVRRMLECTPSGRTGAPQDVAQAVLFLASARNSWLTGEVVYVAGGAQAGRTHVPPADH
jgi:NAD(P)-dependent dehydrogenase (short-subunit alcohol dehydrogenase family)